MTQPLPTRRTVLQLGAVGLGAAAVTGLGTGPAFAQPTRTPRVRVTDLGPGAEVFSTAGATNVGDVVYLATRNIDPMVVAGYDLGSKTFLSVTEVPGSKSTQAIITSPDGRYVYLGLDGRTDSDMATVVRVEAGVPDAPLEDLARIAGFNPLHLAVAPDGMLFLVGQPGGPVHQFDPATNQVTLLATPDPRAQWGRTVVATDTHVYVGYRGRSADGSSSAAGLYAIDRASGASTSILPAEFAAAPELRDLAVIDDRLVAVGVSAGGVGVAIMDLADPTSYTFAETSKKLAKLPIGHDGLIYFAGDGVTELDPATGTFRDIAPAEGEYGETWDLFVRDGRLVVTSGFGLIFEVDPDTSETVVHDLVAQGAPAGPQLAMSITASRDFVYVGGNNAIARHDVRTGEVVNVYAPGEAKDAAIVDGVLYTGQYSGVGVLRYDPATDGQWPTLAATLPHAQNRPQDVQWDEGSQRLLIGSQSDTNQGGAFFTFDPATSTVVTETLDPFGDEQFVRQLTVHEGVVYLGGQLQNGNPSGTLIAWDLAAKKELWRTTSPHLARGITGLAVKGHHLYLMAYAGNFAVLDLRTRELVHQSRHHDLVPGWGTMLVHRGLVYGASAETFYRFDPKTFALQPLVTGLGGEWYGMPRVSVDERGTFYAIRKRNLIRIDVR